MSEAPKARPRLDSIDLVRGTVMVVMALDHVRDFFGAFVDPADAFPHVSAALFLTRWITHYCAPIFVFLTGTGAYLAATRGRTRAQLSRFLLTRGLWLILLELTVVRFGWLYNVNYHLVFLQVIWAIGWALVVLSALVWLPVPAIGGIGVAMIALHNLADGVQPEAFGSLSWLWVVLHVQSPIALAPGYDVMVMYPLVPWLGVAAAGYALGGLYTGDAGRRQRVLRGLGAGMIALFVVLRFTNVYGDPRPWARQESPLFTVLSFVNTTKYPPSLLYLLMTLGPALLALSMLERPLPELVRPLVTFGRVPLFYYVIHLPLIHLLAAVYAVEKYGLATAERLGPDNIPPDYPLSLAWVYGIWLAVVLVLYFPCRSFAALKQRRKDPWLSYL